MAYYEETPLYMVPLWMHGLVYALRRNNYVEHLHMPWDYGLYDDLAFLSQCRRGPPPLTFMTSLWVDLEKRRELLETEQKTMEKPATKTAKQV